MSSKEAVYRDYVVYLLTDLTTEETSRFVSYYKVLNKVKEVTGNDVSKSCSVELYKILSENSLLLEWEMKQIEDLSGYSMSG